MGGLNVDTDQHRGRTTGPGVDTQRNPVDGGGTTIATDSSGGAEITLSLTGVLASIWGGIIGVTAMVAIYIEGSDWYHVLKMAYLTGFVLSLTVLLFFNGVLGTLTDPDRRPVNGPVQIDLVPEDGGRRISVLYYKELPLDKEKEGPAQADGRQQ